MFFLFSFLSSSHSCNSPQFFTFDFNPISALRNYVEDLSSVSARSKTICVGWRRWTNSDRRGSLSLVKSEGLSILRHRHRRVFVGAHNNKQVKWNFADWLLQVSKSLNLPVGGSRQSTTWATTCNTRRMICVLNSGRVLLLLLLLCDKVRTDRHYLNSSGYYIVPPAAIHFILIWTEARWEVARWLSGERPVVVRLRKINALYQTRVSPLELRLARRGRKEVDSGGEKKGCNWREIISLWHTQVRERCYYHHHQGMH